MLRELPTSASSSHCWILKTRLLWFPSNTIKQQRLRSNVVLDEVVIIAISAFESRRTHDM